jgi:hypothetical protein
MDLASQKEQFSRAYVGAVAAAAGFAVYVPSVDDDSVDLGLAARGALGTIHSPRLELQIKCTAVGDLRVDHVRYKLKKKNYDDLRDPSLLVPRILVLVMVPENISEWIALTEDALVLRRCGYWVSILQHPARPNRRSVTLQVPRRQLFSPSTLGSMMYLIGRGGKP